MVLESLLLFCKLDGEHLYFGRKQSMRALEYVSREVFDCIPPLSKVTSESSRATYNVSGSAKILAAVCVEEFTKGTSDIDAWTKHVE